MGRAGTSVRAMLSPVLHCAYSVFLVNAMFAIRGDSSAELMLSFGTMAGKPGVCNHHSGCDRRALPGAALCGPHLDDQKQNREHVWSGAEELPLLQTSTGEEVAIPAPNK